MPTTNAIKLDSGAYQLLARIQNKGGTICGKVQSKIAKACEGRAKPLTADQLEKVLTQAMPKQANVITDASKATATSRYRCDSNGPTDFMTQFLELRIEKDVARVHRRPVTRPYRDPLHAEFIMDKEAQTLLLFNARDIDENGRPLLMKIVAREGVDLDGLKLSAYRTRWEEGKPDVETVAKNASFIAIKDTNESEFEFGDGVVHVSFDAKNEELSRGVRIAPKNLETTRYFPGRRDETGNIVPDTTRRENRTPTKRDGPTLDKTPVNTFDDKIKFAISCKDSFPEGAWLNAKSHHFEAKAFLEPGLIFEPGAFANVKVLNTNLRTEVSEADAFLVGSAGTSADIDLSAFQNHTLLQLLSQSVRRDSESKPSSSSDRSTKSWKLSDLIFANKANIKIGAQSLRPLADTRLTKSTLPNTKISAHYQQIADNPKGQRLCVNLDKGFLASEEGTSIKNWSVVAGYTDENGQWQEAKRMKVSNKCSSSKANFNFNLADAPALYKSNRELELRVFNAEGVPAQRILVPFKEISWA